MAVNEYGTYRILDSKLNAIGVLKLGGKTEFFGDTITHQVADADQSSSSYGESPSTPVNESAPNLNAESKNFDHSGSISVLEKPGTDSDKIVYGNCLAYYDEPQERWYVMKIWHVDRTMVASGGHMITAQLVNLGLWDLHYRLTKKKSMKSASARAAFYWLLQDMDWQVDFSELENYTQTASVEFNDGDKSSAMLQTLLQQYDLECDFYVEYKNNYVTKKIFQVAPEIDSGYYGEAYIGKNVTALSQSINGDVITRLMVKGPNGETMANAGNYVSGPVQHDKGFAYVYDKDANAEYSDGVHWLDGVITTNNISDAAGLMMYGAKLLKMYNHPRISYTVQCTHDFNPKLGATVRTKDFLANPEITTTQRVISRTFSFADPSQNSCSFGEFVTVRRITPAWLANFSSNIQQALQAAKQDASNISVTVLTPDGTDFKGSDQSKRFYIQAWSLGTNISGYVGKQGFEFLKYKSDTINVDGSLDDSQLGQYEKTLYGYSQTLTSKDLGNYRAQVDNDYLTSDAEIYPDQLQANEVASLTYLPFGHKEALQASYRLNDGTFVTTYALADLPDSLNSHNDDCAILHQDSKGNVLGSARIASGGHGSCFGVQEVNSDYCYVYMNTYNDDDSAHKYRLTRIKFMLKQTDVKVTDNKTSRDDFKIGYSTPDYFYFGLDNDTGYGVVAFSKDWKAYSVKLDDLMAGNFKATQVVSLLDYGWNPLQQTWQSVAIKYPYVFWHSGDYDMHDRRVLYGVNLEHKGSVFEIEYNFIDYIKVPAGSQVVEPENLSYKNGKLLVSFNCKVDNAEINQEPVFEIPLVERKEVF